MLLCRAAGEHVLLGDGLADGVAVGDGVALCSKVAVALGLAATPQGAERARARRSNGCAVGST